MSTLLRFAARPHNKSRGPEEVNPLPADRYVSVQEAARMIWNRKTDSKGVSPQRVSTLCRDGAIPGARKLREDAKTGSGVAWLVPLKGIAALNARERPKGRPPGSTHLPKAS